MPDWYSVEVLYKDGTETCALEAVPAKEALDKAVELTHMPNVATIRVYNHIKEATILEWVYGRGIVHPPGLCTPEDAPSVSTKTSIVISFECDGTNAIIEFDTEQLDDLLAHLDKKLQGRSYKSVVKQFMHYLLQARATGESKIEAYFELGIWIIFRYEGESPIRSIMEKLILEGITPYICWYVEPQRGLAICCADRYTNLRNAIPEDTPPGHYKMRLDLDKPKPTVH